PGRTPTTTGRATRCISSPACRRRWHDPEKWAPVFGQVHARTKRMTMRVLLLYAHPVETSFNAALHDGILTALKGAGHIVDDCDLYAENFDPRLTREERLGYHE